MIILKVLKKKKKRKKEEKKEKAKKKKRIRCNDTNENFEHPLSNNHRMGWSNLSICRAK